MYIFKIPKTPTLKRKKLLLQHEKNPDTKDYISYDSICMKFLEKAKLQRQKASNWLPRLWKGPRINANWYERNFFGDGSVLKLDIGNGCIIVEVY